MSDWTEDDSATFRELGDIAVPRRSEMVATLVTAVPFGAEERFRIVEIGSGDGRLAHLLLACFPEATLLALDGSESMRHSTTARTSVFGTRIQVRAFELATPDWWELMRGADVVVSSMCLHHLNDAKKQYLYRAVADRLSERGALLVADLIEPLHASPRRLAAETWDAAAKMQADAAGVPDLFRRFVDGRWNHYWFPDQIDHPSALFHHLVWLRHAGFLAVDCLWLYAGHAVYGGFREVEDSRRSGGIPYDRVRSMIAAGS
jgi:tRNA (cmo5U34)-methyltransferase